jgi:hypothetical protein
MECHLLGEIGEVMKKPYWKNDFYNRKYYKLTDAKKFADDIQQATGVRPIFTYHRMLGAMWVRTQANV